MTTHHSPVRRLVYGHARMHDCLAFADLDTAAQEATEITAIASARTWGEARRIHTEHVRNPVGPIDDEDLTHEPADGAPFDINEVSSVVEGDWPGMVTARAFALLPHDVQDRFGKRVATVHNGDYLDIPVDREAELVADLRQRGYEVTRDDELINTLDGRGFSPLGG